MSEQNTAKEVNNTEIEQAEEITHADSAIESEAEHKVDLTLMDADSDSKDGAEIAGSVRPAQFAPLNEDSAISEEQGGLNLLLDVQLELSVELGRTAIPVREVLQLGPGSIVELERLSGEPVDIMINGKLIARGEVVVVDENFGIRVTEIASKTERLSRLS